MKHERAIQVIEKLIKDIKNTGEGETVYWLVLSLEVAISQLIADEKKPEPESIARRAGAFVKNELGKWVRIGQ